MLVTLPFVLLLLDYWPLRRYAGLAAPAAWSQLILEKVPLLALSAACSILTVLAQSAGGAIAASEHLPAADRLGNAFVTYVVYLRQAVCPLGLAIFYPHPAGQLRAWQVLGAALVLLAITALAVVLRRRTPALLVGWLWYLGTLIPVIGLVQVGGQARADRYTYVPLVGVFLAVAWAVPARLAGRPRVQLGLGVAVGFVLAACALCTWFQQGY